MRVLPPEPAPGDKITAELVRELIRCIRERQLIKGPNYSTSTGPNGTYLKLELPKRQTFPRAPLPYEVRWAQSENNGEGAWVIWLPDTAKLLSYDGEYVTLAGITASQALPDGWYTIDDLDGESEGVYLIVEKDTPSGGDSSETPTISAKLSGSDGESEGEEEKVVALLVAEIETDSGTGAKRVKQYVDSAVTLGASDAVSPDDISIETILPQEEGEEPTGQEGKLQIFDFDTNESDSPEGFVERLKADTETGKIKLESGTNIMLIARRNGKIVYIPLSADGEDPEDEKPFDPDNPDGDCGHPGDNASDGETSWRTDDIGAGGVDGGAGGVPAGGDEPHTGDDDCNCDKE